MYRYKRVVSAVLAVLSLTVVTFTQTGPDPGEVSPPANYSPPEIVASSNLQSILDAAITESLAAFADKKFKSDEVSATLIDVKDPGSLKSGEVRGGARIYPASVVKLFYLAALERLVEAGKVRETDELKRGRRDMIVVSSNEATQYILDVITNTASGAELPDKEFQIWQAKRNRVNRFFEKLGYKDINVNQKTFCEDAYGIEQQSRNYHGENRNMLTTNATARLLAEIVLGRVAGPARTAEMLGLLRRDPFSPTTDPDDQSHGFSGKMLFDRGQKDVKLWSKAGWTSKARHDAAYFETPDGQKFVLVVFTENHAGDSGFIPMVAGKVLTELSKKIQ